MPLISWNNGLSVSVDCIDSDHQHLIDLVNQLYDACAAGSARLTLDPIFDELTTYTCTHFAREEELFEASEYPLIDKHKREHAEMFAWIQQARENLLQQDSVASSFELLDFLKSWLFSHIGGSDRRMAPYLRQACLDPASDDTLGLLSAHTVR